MIKIYLKIVTICDIIKEIGEIIMCLEKIVKNSADEYYYLLNKNNKGIISYDVKQIEKLSLDKQKSNIFRFRVNSKINIIDDLQIQILNKVYPKSYIKIIMYDEDSKQLIISLSNEILLEYNNIETINCEDIKLIYDLKFLVARVSDWFGKYKITKPSNESLTFNDINDIKIFNNCSKEQIEAVQTALTSPISYIWGAPGTGKTQYVLTNAILNYTKLNKKVIVVAPTNNAIEQVLSSIIKITDSLNINRSQIIRLGTPTKKFFEKYPEVCENKSLKKIMPILFEKQYFYKGLLQHKHIKSTFEEVNHKILKRIKEEDEKFSFNENLINTNKILKDDVELNSKKINLLLSNYYNVMADKKLFFNKKKLLNTKIKEFFSKKFKQSLNKELNSLLNKEEKILKEIEIIKHINQKKTQQIKQNLLDVKEINLLDIKEYLLKLNISALCLKNENFEKVKNNLIKELKSIGQNILDDDILYKDYIDDDEKDIKEKFDKVTAEIENKNPKTTQTRVKTSLILGMTLDTFIYTQIPTKTKAKTMGSGINDVLEFNAEHIFLDEAGYSNLAKTLTLFHNNQPITFLGDHFQLPPVYELDDFDINNNDILKLWIQSGLYAIDFIDNGLSLIVNKFKNSELPNFDNLKKCDLTLTYRFGQNLLDVLNTNIYKTNMKSAPNKSNIEILYIDAPKISCSNQKRVNLDEVKVIYNYVAKHKNEDISILTPYRNQLFELKKRFGFYTNENILTVHGSQGREWDTVILSVCDTNDKYFTDSNNKNSNGRLILNTAISRVKKKLIIVCDYNYWISQGSQLISKLLKIATPADVL